MHVAQLSAALNAKGEVESLRIKSAGDAISPRWISRVLPALSGPFDAPDKTTAEGLFDLPYGFANQHMAHVSTRMGVPIGFWRSVGHSHNAFFSESFIDELAFETKQDPLAFRLSLLKEAPRYAAVLKLAAVESQVGSSFARRACSRLGLTPVFWIYRGASGRGFSTGRYATCALCGVCHRLRHSCQSRHSGAAS